LYIVTSNIFSVIVLHQCIWLDVYKFSISIWEWRLLLQFYCILQRSDWGMGWHWFHCPTTRDMYDWDSHRLVLTCGISICVAV